MNSGIYHIKNLANGMMYVGRACDWKKRQRQHRHSLVTNKHQNTHLQHAWNKYGENCFEFRLIWQEQSDRLVELEGLVLDELFDSGRLYNMHKSSEGGLRGMRMSDASKAKLALSRASSEAVKAHIERISAPEFRAIAIAAAATPEARAKAVSTRAANGHKPFSDEVRQRQMDESKARVFAAIDWAVANGETRDAALNKFSCSWCGLKKYQPEWEAIHGALTLPKRANGERNGMFKHGMSKEIKRKRTPEELANKHAKHSESMRGENNPMFGRKHSEEARRIQSEAAKKQAEDRRNQQAFA